MIAAAAAENKEPEMAKEENADLSAQLAEAQANIAKVSADLQAATELAEEMAAKFTEVKTALEASEALKATLVAEASAKRLEARTKIIVDAVGTDKAEHLLAATNSLGDEQFNAVVSAMAMSFEKEAKSAPFVEAGVSADVTPQEVKEADEVEQLAEKLAAKFNQTNI